jgi:hypothetical protein
MKNLWSKKAVVSVLMLASLISGGYNLLKKYHLGFSEAVASVPEHKRAVLKPITFADADNELQACYESYLSRDPKSDDGQVLFHMKLSTSGEVNYLEMVHSDFDDHGFIDCVTNKVRAMREPASSDRVGVLIAHRFKFHRKDREHMDFEN